MQVDNRIISDGMVLQRGEQIVLEGKLKVDGFVTLTFQGKSYTCESSNGTWDIVLQDLKVGGPFDLEIVTPDEKRVIRDVLVGDVFVMAGQSNMELNVNAIYYHDQNEIDEFNSPFVRQFKVSTSYDFTTTLENTRDGVWKNAVGRDKGEFGAIGFFMAKLLYQKSGVPIGLIQTAVPGCPIESYLSKENLLKFLKEMNLPKACASQAEIEAVIEREEAIFEAMERQIIEEDKKSEKKDWKYCTIPIELREEQPKSGCYWFRKEIHIPEETDLTKAVLKMGLIIEADYTYVNGVFVGYTPDQYQLRRYELPEGVLKHGKNEILVQVIVKDRYCRLWEGQDYFLEIGEKRYNLIGLWQYRKGFFLEEPFPPKTYFEYFPLGVYQAMTYPLLEYKATALLWYQGESNVDEPEGYYEKFAALAEQYRSGMNKPELPIYFVQIDKWRDPNNPTDDRWCIVREEQKKCLAIPNTHMIQAYKYGDPTNLHPQNKKGIGEEIAMYFL